MELNVQVLHMYVFVFVVLDQVKTIIAQYLQFDSSCPKDRKIKVQQKRFDEPISLITRMAQYFVYSNTRGAYEV